MNWEVLPADAYVYGAVPDLAGYLGQQKSAAKNQSGDMSSYLFDLVDANDDGSVVDDVMRMAKGFMASGKKA